MERTDEPPHFDFGTREQQVRALLVLYYGLYEGRIVQIETAPVVADAVPRGAEPTVVPAQV